MHLRPATTRDLHRLTEIMTTSLIDDPTYDYMWTKRRAYPEDNIFWSELKLERHLYDRNSTFLVVEISREEIIGGESDLVGKAAALPASIIISYGIWERFGTNRAARKRLAAKDTWLNRLERTIATIRRWSINRKYQRRDGDAARVDAVAAASAAVKDKYFADASDWWSMELLVTDRAFRHRGAATKIVEWGILEAEKESLCCGVEASPMGARLYSLKGFAKVDTWVVQVPGDDATLVYDVMRREPTKQ